jgi:predicted PurR-regulated permease PerM
MPESEVTGGFRMKTLTGKDYKNILLYIALSAAVILSLKYILPYFLPIIVAFIIVIPLQGFYKKHARLNSKFTDLSNRRSIMAGAVLFGIVLAIALIIVGVGTFLVGKAVNVTDFILEVFTDISSTIDDFFGLESGALAAWLLQRLENIGNGILAGSAKYVSLAGRIGTFVVVSFICVILFAREIEGWQQGLLHLAAIEPSIDHILSIVLRIGKKLGSMIKAYLKTQSVILVCISTVSVIGLYIGGTKEGWFYGILAGIMDFLPFIGTGIVLIPIGVLKLLNGKIFGGIVTIITYVACVLIREILEPRLLGSDMKFSPVAILISVYAGVIYYGIGGVILGPMTLLILVELGREIFSKQ